jgi:hypothetical protein
MVIQHGKSFTRWQTHESFVGKQLSEVACCEDPLPRDG